MPRRNTQRSVKERAAGRSRGEPADEASIPDDPDDDLDTEDLGEPEPGELDDDGLGDDLGEPDLEQEDLAEEDLAEDEENTEEAEEEAEAGDESLEGILNQHGSRLASDDDGDEADVIALVSERDDTVTGDLPERVVPIKSRQEFVCRRCFLVKSRTQLADRERQLCRDCV